MRTVPWATVRERCVDRLTRYIAADGPATVEERLVLAVWLTGYRARFGFEAAGAGRPGWEAPPTPRRQLVVPECRRVPAGDKLALF